MTEPKWYDITLFASQGWTIEKIVPIMEEHCERFVVGREHASTTGNEHYQCRVVFKTGKERGAVVNLFPGCHCDPSHVRDFNYCEKEGDFYRSWEKALNKYAMASLNMWQGQMIAQLKDQNDRQVMVVHDAEGGLGKTFVAKYCQIHRIAQYVPPLQDAQDFMAFAMAKPSSGYIFDMPRTESVKQKHAMWSAVEQIKNGYLYDKRYSYRDMWIEPPKVIVFTNEMPDLGVLSADRWQLFTLKYSPVHGEYTLEKYEPSERLSSATA